MEDKNEKHEVTPLEMCPLCGEQKPVGKECPNHNLKKMCLNCSFLSTEQPDKLPNRLVHYCNCDANLEVAKQQMIEAAKQAVSSYEIVNFEITPLPLKKPTGKCKYWCLNEQLLLDELKNAFV